MKAIAFFSLLVTLSKSDTITKVNLTDFYENLGCSPDNEQNGIVYNCPELHPDKAKCYYKGKPYESGTYIPQSLIGNPCLINCFCSVRDYPEFNCASLDCPTSVSPDMAKQCVDVDGSLDTCCPTKSVCGKDAIANLTNCVVNGKTYYEGQIFYTPSRSRCICSQKWRGVPDDINCRPISCGVEINFQYQLMMKCAPVFYKENDSCPFYFVCPDNSTKVIIGENLTCIKTKCAFGNITLSIGDEVSTKEKCTKCSCQNPPFISCIKKDSYC